MPRHLLPPRAHAAMVLESGSKLAAALTEDDLAAVIAGPTEAREMIEEELPAQIERALAVIARAGE